MRVTVIGAGYVGLVTGACLSALDHDVTCVDVAADRIAAIERGDAPFFERGLSEILKEGLTKGKFKITSSLSDAMKDSDISIIAVGTPPGPHGVDLSYIQEASRQIGENLKQAAPYHTIVVKSTVPPGTASGLVRGIVEKASGISAGEFGICMNPEFLREGCAVEDFMEPDRIVIGEFDERSGQTLEELYKKFDCVKMHTSLENAELIKYSSNSLLSVLISFSNEIAGLCEALPGTDIDTVMDGLHLDRRLSPMSGKERTRPQILSYLRAGAGFGGSCLPKDVNALRAFAASRGVEMHLLDATMKVNQDRPEKIIRLLEAELGDLDNCIVTVLGLAFKPDTDDLRDSPALAIIKILEGRGVIVRGYDPLVTNELAKKAGLSIEVFADVNTALTGASAAVIATGWPQFTQFDWHQVTPLMAKQVIVDGRNILRNTSLPNDATYRPIGRSAPVKNSEA